MKRTVGLLLLLGVALLVFFITREVYKPDPPSEHITSDVLLERIRTAILVHEPRIQLLDLMVDDQRAVEGVLQIRLDYAVRSTNTRFNLVLPYYLGDANELRASVTGN